MPENKEVYVLSDPLEEPTDELLRRILGEKYGWLEQIYLHAMPSNSNVTVEWKYYKDARQWLGRLLNRKDTICWIGILENAFRVTFYFNARHEHWIDTSNLPPEVRQEWKKTIGKKFRPISVLMEKSDDIELVKQLADLKIEK